ncbi:MAG: hypothetical protein ACFFCG_09060 [Promethearchaeota archaeon]
MDNLDDYILSVQKYKKGVYEFEITSSPEEIKKAVERGIPEEVKKAVTNGKKFVCIEEGSLGLFVLGAFLILVWVFFELLIQFIYNIHSFPRDIITIFLSVAMFVVFVGLGLYCIGLELLILTKPFIVLSEEGFVYKLRAGEVKGFNWDDISMDFFEFSDKYGRYKNLIRISLVNGSIIKLGTGDPKNRGRVYASKIIPNEKQIGIGHNSHFLFLTFKAYYNYGKYGRFEHSRRLIDEDTKDKDWKNSLKRIKESSYKERKISVEPPNHLTIEVQKNMEINSFLNELKEAYNNYKNKNYTFGTYNTTEQIQIAHANGKIFVLKGGTALIWTLFIFTLILSVWWFVLVIFALSIEPSDTDTFIIVSTLALSTIGFFTVVPCILFGLSTRMFLVIGPSGVYYRRFFKANYFQWCNVTAVEGRIDTIKPRVRDPPVKTAQVSIILNNGEKVRFTSLGYRSKEFPRNFKRILFLSLFQIYSGQVSLNN